MTDPITRAFGRSLSTMTRETYEYVAGQLGHEKFMLVSTSKGSLIKLDDGTEYGPSTDINVLVSLVLRPPTSALEDTVRRLGFDSEEEFHRLVSGADLSTPVKIAAFRRWKFEDGSKAGLLALGSQR